MNQSPEQAPEKPRNPSLVLWTGLLVLTALVFVYLLAAPRGARNQGRNHPGVGIELSTIQFEPLTGRAQRVRRKDLRGKVTLINFWAPWCPACRQEMPYLIELEKEFGKHDDFRLILVSNDPGADFATHREQTAEYIRQLDPTQPVWHDPYLFTFAALVREAKLPDGGIPVTAVLDRQGVLRGLWAGFNPENDPPAMTDLVAELLESPGGESAGELSWQAQIEQVRAGASDKIAVEKAVVTDADLALLNGLTGLKTLAIERSQVSDEGLKPLATLANLESLKLRGAAVGDEGVHHLAGLANLRFVNLPQARFSDEGLAALAELPKLEQLRFGSPNVTDAGMTHIAGMRSLRFLHLIHTPITDAGLQHLHEVKTLESFYIDGGRITDEGLSRLLKAIPNLHIHVDQHHLDNDPHARDHTH